MTDRELLKEARDLIVMCSLLDKSGQCEAMADKIDKQLSIANVVGRSEQLVCPSCNSAIIVTDKRHNVKMCGVCKHQWAK